MQSEEQLKQVLYDIIVILIQMCGSLQSLSATSKVPFHNIRMYINDLYLQRGIKSGERLYAMSKSFIQGASGTSSDETSGPLF